MILAPTERACVVFVTGAPPDHDPVPAAGEGEAGAAEHLQQGHAGPQTEAAGARVQATRSTQ